MWTENHHSGFPQNEGGYFQLGFGTKKYISPQGVTLTCEFSIDHDVQVFLWVGADVSGDGVETNGGILQ